MKKHIRNILKRNSKKFIKGKIEIILLLLLLFSSAFLRFYNLNKLAFFSYDQARDALYIKRIIVDHTFRLISTQCSGIPGLYNGPAYYYLMAPFLWLFKLNPIGIDFGVAFFGLLTVFVFYFLAKSLTGNFFIAWLSAMIFSFQPQIVLQSRFGWNPNLLPFFSLVFIFGLWLLKKGKNWSWFLVFISLAIMLHLHYSAICFFPILFLWLFVSRKKIKFGSYFLSSLILFLVLMSPLLLFDIRHNFINTKAVWLYFQQGPLMKAPPPPFFAGLLEKLEYILPQMVFGIRHKLLSYLLIFILFLTAFFIYKNYKKFKDSLFLLFSWLILGVLFVSFNRGSFYNYYLTFLYPVGFLIVAVLANFFWRKGRLVRILLIFLFISIFINNYGRLEVFKPPSRTIEDLKNEAQIIAQDVPQDRSFNLASVLKDDLSGYYNAVDYRYFLETFYGKKALDWEPIDYQQSEILYLMSEKKLIDPLQVTAMELQEFQPKEILEVWELPSNRVIYKLGK